MDDDNSIAQAMQRLANVAINECDEPHVRSVLAQIGQVQQWLDHRKVALTRRLQQLAVATPSIQPQQVLASATNISRLEAYREVARATTLGHFPQLEQAFNDGYISTAHIDALSRAAHHLNPDERQLLAQRSEWLNTVAAHATPDNFARAVKSEVARLHADEGITTLQRQRRDTTLRHWVDRESGMFHINGRLDPECGLRIIGRIDNTVETLFHGALPDTCPTDDRKHGHLNALSLVALIDGSVAASSSPNARAEVSVVIDLQTLLHGMHQRSVIRTGHEVDLPIETIRRMACEAEIIPVVLGSNGVVLDVGRATRLASRYQRKALEVMYSTCAIPQCCVPHSQCQPHHIRYWREDGTTDMNNLVPLCSSHHRSVHEGGWKLSMHGTDRQLAITRPEERPPPQPPDSEFAQRPTKV